jgi:hypothetical protein
MFESESEDSRFGSSPNSGFEAERSNEEKGENVINPPVTG